MNISKEEARESLSAVQNTVERTKKAIAGGGGDSLFIVWGVIWFLGYMCMQMLPPVAVWIWLGLVVSGIVISVVVVKVRTPVRSPVDKRIFWFWWVLFAYAGLWLGLLLPFVKVSGREESAAFWKHWGAIAATVPMFAYVVTGLWLEHFIIWIGLAVTGIAILGLFLLQPYFWVWMAFAGGGTLIGTGIFIRYRWR